MSKQKVQPKAPHSLELRAKQRKMPTTAGVHLLSAKEPASSDPVQTEQSKESKDSARLNEIHAAISIVDPDNESLWTKNGGPKVSTVEKLLGYQITEAERDAAWHLEKGE